MTVPSFPVSASGLDQPPRLTIRFGPATDPTATTFSIGLPVIAGEGCEALFPDAVPAGHAGSFALFTVGNWLLGCAVTPASRDLEPTTLRLYEELIAATHGRSLCRIWNYVPAINAAAADGLDNYQAFSRARSLAFERAHGADFKRWLPAASAVGSSDGMLAVVFAASHATPVHRENPRQVPAYEYPNQYGPRSPSFARATVVPRADGRRDVFVSGTSAITGHLTIHPDDPLAQTRCTLENLREVAQACGLGNNLGAVACLTRHVKVYLRRASDHAVIAPLVGAQLVQSGDTVSYLVADICRAALHVEIEVTLLGVSPAVAVA